VARVRWTAVARQDFVSLVRWYRLNRDPVVATRVAASVMAAVRRAAARPLLYSWVGSIHSELADQPTTVRRIVAQPPQHTIYYHYDATAGEVNILHIRGPGQDLPRSDQLRSGH
jgi:plasmid stabilization system protein ParE